MPLAYRLQGEKGVEDRVSDLIELDLKTIQEFVQAPQDDFFHVSIVKLRDQLPQVTLGRIPECPQRSAGDRVQGFAGPPDTVTDRSGELRVENQKRGRLT